MIDVVFSFDTTGSMYPCLASVRSKLKKMTEKLFSDIDDIRIGLIAHGDYCDAHNYVTMEHYLSNDVLSLSKFATAVPPTGGGDLPECYELVMHKARYFNWREGASRVFVMIGDATPHPVNYKDNKKRLDWRLELRQLVEDGTVVYPVQCLNRSYATPFYDEVARISGTNKLSLDQFTNVEQLIMAVCYKQGSNVLFDAYKKELADTGVLNRGIQKFLNQLSGADVNYEIHGVSFKESALEAVPPYRFQMLDVGNRVPIKEFVQSTGAIFKVGRGFYELTKPETIQEKKEVVLVDKESGDMYSGTKAREMIGLPYGLRGRIRPLDIEDVGYDVFVQSTSYNRILMPGTRFLYEVEDWDA